MEPAKFTETISRYGREMITGSPRRRGRYDVEFGVTDMAGLGDPGDLLSPPQGSMTNRLPTPVGADVHYVSYGTPGGEYPSVCRAAKITEAAGVAAEPLGERIGLCVLNPEGLFFNRGVAYDGGKIGGEPTALCFGAHYEGGTWHWAAGRG